MEVLPLKNLIGRAGRSSSYKSKFDLGYIIIKNSNLKSFVERLNSSYEMSETSKLDDPTSMIEEDEIDLVEAIRNDTFDIELGITKTQVERIEKSKMDSKIKNILDLLFINDKILTGHEYYENISEDQRNLIKDGFKSIFISHLRRTELTHAESSILSASIPILLWHIQGKSFSEVLALRFSYLTQQSKRRELKRSVREGRITVSVKLFAHS